MKRDFKKQKMTIVLLIAFHAGAIGALFFFSWQMLVMAAVLLYVGNSWGIGIGFHRYLTHRGYKTSKPVEYFLTICGLLPAQGGPIHWVVTHRIHHAHTDKPGDPHTPREGGYWAHVGWVLHKNPQLRDSAVLQHYAPDLMKDGFHRFVNRFWYAPIIILTLIIVVATWSLVPILWVMLNLTVGLHNTWLVNSAAHLWGKRRFETTDDSTNNWWVALLSFGEGWHNNHHAHPTSARHGLAWYEIDFNWWGIRVMALIRLVRKVKVAKLEPSLETT